MRCLKHGNPAQVLDAGILSEVDVRHRELQLADFPSLQQGQLGTVGLRRHRVEQNGCHDPIFDLPLLDGVPVRCPRTNRVRWREDLPTRPVCRLEPHDRAERHRTAGHGLAQPVNRQFSH